jgi:phosphate transport system substrate-binding protein
MNRRTAQVAIILALVLIGCPFLSDLVLSQGKIAIRADGGTLLAEPVDDYAKLFAERSKDCSVTVHGSSTGIGFERLIRGEADLAMMTRAITEAEERTAREKGIKLSNRMFGYIALAVITNNKNPISELTIDQLRQIFTGERHNWVEMGGPNEPIRVLTRPVPATGSGVLFQEKILGGRPYADGHQVMTSWQSMFKVCSRSLAIGYMPTTSAYFANMEKEGVKIIRLKKDEKSLAISLEAGIAKETTYPVAVPFYFYWDSNRQSSCLMDFVEFVATKAQ